MGMQSIGRPTAPFASGISDVETVSGSKGLMQREDLIFEIGCPEKTGVDLPAPKGTKNRLGGVTRQQRSGLPGLSEPEAVRHYMRLSQKNYAIDLGLFPLGSCTMKHNPRLNEKTARMPGFADMHSHLMFQMPFGVAFNADREYWAYVASTIAEQYLMQGFTTVRDVGGNSFSLKLAIDQGILDGPRVYPSGPMI